MLTERVIFTIIMITVRGTNIAQGVHGVSKEIDFRNAAAVIANT